MIDKKELMWLENIVNSFPNQYKKLLDGVSLELYNSDFEKQTITDIIVNNWVELRKYNEITDIDEFYRNVEFVLLYKLLNEKALNVPAIMSLLRRYDIMIKTWEYMCDLSGGVSSGYTF